MPEDIVLIHGAFAGPWSFDDYNRYFSERGHTVHAPALPYHDGDPAADPEPGLTTASIADYTDAIAGLVSKSGTKPVLIGHAVGGLIAQQVAARGLASGIVLINPNSPWGRLPATDDERAVPRGLMEGGAFWNEPMRVPFDLMAPFALNKLSSEQQHAVFDRLGPESGRVMFEMFFWMFDDKATIKVPFDDVNCPVLIVSGSDDRAVNPASGRELADMYGDRATWHVAEGHAHFLFLEPGWQGPAEAIATWIDELRSA